MRRTAAAWLLQGTAVRRTRTHLLETASLSRFSLGLALVLLLVFPIAAHADSPTTHVVAWGETLYGIAQSYGVSPQTIANLNGLTLNSWVYTGQRLLIPVSAATTVATTPSGYYTVRAGDTLFSIATQFGISVAAISAANNLPDDGVIYVGWTLRIPTKASPPAADSKPVAATTYIVQPGDYLTLIAMNYGVTMQAIMLANNLPNDWFIYSGQRLVIPNGQPVAPAAPAAAAVTSINARVSNIPLYRQQQTLTCEESSVAMATRGAVSEARLVAVVPRSDNPFVGIRGRTNSPYYGGLTDYGVYAQPLQKGLTTLGIQSQLLYGQAYADFKNALIEHLGAGHPVVWWHTWHDTYQIPVMIKMADGTRVKLVPYEHAGVIIAANDRGVTYHDPYDATVRFVSWADHRRVSGYFDNMALVILR